MPFLEGLLQPTHLILILVIVLIVFGPGKLPEIGSALGKSIREFRQSTKDEDKEKDKATVAATTKDEPTASTTTSSTTTTTTKPT